MARLKETYLNEIVDAMMKKFEYKNVMQVPKLDKIVINMGVGEAKENSKVLDTAISDLEIITGQKAVVTRNPSQTSNCVRVSQSVVKLLFVVQKCMSLQIV